jgi:hypothetical protein
MRTTLEIDDDVLAAAKELARRERSSAGAVLSKLARRALTGAAAASPVPEAVSSRAIGGFQPFPSRGVVVSNDDVDALREAEGI